MKGTSWLNTPAIQTESYLKVIQLKHAIRFVFLSLSQGIFSRSEKRKFIVKYRYMTGSIVST